MKLYQGFNPKEISLRLLSPKTMKIGKDRSNTPYENWCISRFSYISPLINHYEQTSAGRPQSGNRI